MIARAAVLTAMSLVAGSVSARADIVFFATGQHFSVDAHRQDGDSLVLVLRGGGEMRCPASLVARIEPDEVPPQASAAPAAPEPVTQPSATPRVAPRLRTDPQYDSIIQAVAREQGLDASLVRAVIQVESGYSPRARSPRGALGLMQVMPETARRYGVGTRRLYEPRANIEIGSRHLRSLLDRLPLALALAAYNAGEAAVARFSGVPPYPETQHYVSSVLALLLD
jgi:soluble lytic murein transglycosylase-like protein